MPEHRVVRILRRTDLVVDGLRGKAFEKPRHYIDAMALFDRCHNLFKAIRHLVVADFVHEAAVLT